MNMIIKTDLNEIQNYLVDASNFKGFCDAVYFPQNEKEISEILKETNEKNISVTVAGNGTGLTGARVPQGGIVISTEKLNRIIEINPKEFFAIVEPGVVLSEFQEQIKERNLLYPPDPTEKNCFIGGTVATNASGEKTFKYGPTRNFVLELDIILPDGDKLKLTRGSQKADGFHLKLKTQSGKDFEIELPEFRMPSTKNTAGYFCKKDMDAIDLFIGSEGTLGVITKIKLKLLPRPEKLISCVVFFDNEINAFKFIEKARDISLNTKLRSDPRCIEALALEFFDERAINFLRNDYSQIPHEAKSAVWFEQEVTHQNEEIFFDGWMDLIKEFHGDEESAWFAITEDDKKKIQEFRHSISAKINEFITRNNFRKLGTDAAVPNDRFEEFYTYSKTIVEKNRIDFVIYGHAGNSHIHLNMLPKNEKEFAEGESLYSMICKKAVELGGTASAEHGIGKVKTNYLLEMYGKETIDKMIQLKRIFDPNMILGKGNIFKS